MQDDWFPPGGERFSFFPSKPGEKVRVTDCPFERLEGHVETIDAVHGKGAVTVASFGCDVPTEVESWQIERL